MAWTLGKLFGIPIRLHYTMVLVPFLTYNLMTVHTLFSFAMWLLLVVLLFGSVLLHELGHALTARRFGIVTQDIVLTPLGGMARVVSMPKNPKQEIAIAIAGPLVSLAIAAVAFFGYPFAVLSLPMLAVDIVERLFQLNFMLALFNLVPALPMDGGRVLRGVLALKRDHLTATRLAARVGRILAVIGGIYGLMNESIVLSLIAVFVYIMAGSEVRMAEMRARQEAWERGGSSPSSFPFGGMPGGRQVWTWDTRQHGVRGGAEPYTASQKPSRESGWSTENDREEGDVVVVSGKAEVVGRKDPH